MTDRKAGPVPEAQTDMMPVAYPDLKSLREAKGLTLRDIYEQTRISSVNLEAIESGQFHRLPAPVYARHFIRSYALLIGVESKVLLDAYERHLQSLKEQVRRGQEAGETQRTAWWGHRKRIAWLFSAAASAIVAVLLLVTLNQTGPVTAPVHPEPSAKPETQVKPVETAPPAEHVVTHPATPREQEKTARPEPVLETTRQPEAMPAKDSAVPAVNVPVKGDPAEKLPPAKEGKYHLFMEARETVWLRIREDRNQSEQMILNPGETLERFASESFMVDIGNAGGIDITFQGKPVGSLGKRGQVVHLRFP